MKKGNLIILLLLYLTLMTGCNRTKIIEYDRDDFQSISVWTYDLQNQTSTENWIYKDKDTKDILDYLESLKGEEIENPNLSESLSVAYGVMIMESEDIKLTFIDDYVVTSDGKYYIIDQAKAQEVCSSIKGNTRTFDDLFMMNHRYISLQDGNWDTTLMVNTNFNKPKIENINWTCSLDTIGQEAKSISTTLVNKSNSTIEFGDGIGLEVLIDSNWYSVSNMTNNGIELCWNSILNIIEPDGSQSIEFYLEYYQPLPIGEYRLVKHIDNVNGDSGMLYLNFKIN